MLGQVCYLFVRFLIFASLLTLLSLSSWCPVIAVWYFLAVSWVCLQFVIVVYPDHTHYCQFMGFHIFVFTYMLFSVDSRASLRLLYWFKQHIPSLLQSGSHVHVPQQGDSTDSVLRLRQVAGV